MKSELAMRTEAYLVRERLMTGADRVTVALSGGRDSVCLLFVMREIAAEWGFPLSAVHINHGLRETAQRDEQFVRGLCEELGIPLTVYHVDTPKLMKERKLGAEEAARVLRHQAFDKVDTDKLAVAHHTLDRAETLLLNLMRGSGTAGLSAMRPSRGKLIRPLLFALPEEIDAYIAEQGLSFCEDETNEDLSFRRNRVRRELIPYLERYFNPSVTETLAETAERLREDDDFLEHEAEQAYYSALATEPEEGLIASAVVSMPAALRVRVLRRFLTENGGLTNVGTPHLKALIQLAEGPSGKRVNLPGDLTVEKRCGILTSCSIALADAFFTAESEQKFPIPVTVGKGAVQGETCLTGAKLVACLSAPPKKEQLLLTGRDEEWLRIPEAVRNGERKLIIRSRAQGDYLYAGGKKSLQDFLVNNKVPKTLRDRLPLLCEEGSREIIWVIGIRPNDRYLLNEGDNEALHLKLLRLQ